MLIGIDPGKTGAIAWCHESYSPGLANVVSMPGFDAEITKFLRTLNTQLVGDETVKVWIEKQAYMQGDGGKGVATFMQGYGYLLGSLRMLGWSVDEVPPMKWKRQQGVLVTKTPVPMSADGSARSRMAREHKKKLKDASIARAMSLYPDVDYGTNRASHTEGRAEALLILQYGRDTTMAAANVPTPQWEIDDQ